ncbi:MAG: serine/threonine protein kinase [Alphaproteobacteria bacterium]|nr:serine/threonine protein kinase [Alphaproteobacteria bacterium]MCW5742628.1 serine/threonine protein kinase [Alphaproteobacteria bacterium]
MSPSSAPQKIGRYVIESTIGKGAMGVIYLAHDPMINRPVALKLVNTDLLEGDDRAAFVERFQREAQAAGRCSHGNIVAIYDFALHGNDPYIAMEFVAGRSLAQVIDGGARLPIDASAMIARQMLDALACAHGQGVVHRDIKPANVLLTGDGRVKVTDFGISRVGGSSLTQTGALIGTPNYMSPEQCRGEEVDARSDLFSTAAVFYELLTGVRPFAGRNFHEVTYQLLYGEPAPLSKHLPTAPAALVAFMTRALARDAARRFESADAMNAALSNALRGQAPAAAGTSDATVVAPSPAAVIGPHLQEIERRLAAYVGPIAGYLVRSASGRTSSIEELCRSLSTSIDKAEQREAFLRDALKASRTGAGVSGTIASTLIAPQPSAATASIAQADLDRAQAELARHIGPIATLLMRRERAAASGAEDLWQRLAGHIDKPADRETFLRNRAQR